MAVNIIILLVGFILGFVVCKLTTKSKCVGTMYISKSDGEKPLLYLELNEGVIDNVNDNDIVQMQVRNLRENSQK